MTLLALHLRRGLQAADIDDTVGGDADSYLDERGGATTLKIRIAGVFAILVMGLLGALPPLCFSVFRTPGAPLPRLLRALAAGVILGLATIHVIPEAVGDLSSLAERLDPVYDFSGLTILFGILLMVFLQSLAHTAADSKPQPAVSSPKGLAAQPIAEGIEEPPSSLSNSHLPHPGLQSPNDTHDNSHILLPVAGIRAANGDPNDPHTHECLRTSHYNLSFRAAGGGTASMKDQVMAMLFEMGCIFHSFIIGISLGVISDDRTTARALVIALSVHQCLEGLALGGFIATSGFTMRKCLCMVAAYSLTCPTGVAIGIGIAHSYDETSLKAVAIEGTFNGISGGMLLYIALVMLIAEDFSRVDEEAAHAPKPVQTVLSLRAGSLTWLSNAASTTRAAGATRLATMAQAASFRMSKPQFSMAQAPNLRISKPEFPLDLEQDTAEHSHDHTPRWLKPACHAALALGGGCMAALAIWA